VRILIVDDHAGFRAMARRMLEGEGHCVVGEAGDGAGAVVEAGRLAPDVVLLDLNLPDTSGLAVARELRAAAAPPAVVITSTHDEVELDELARQSGASGFVPKTRLTGATLAATCDRG
jgi:two-component system nitrate/nitrite response regulator NarL